MQSIILITDSYPAANGGGISQTLYNLLDGYEGEIAVLVPETEKLPAPGERLAAKLVSLKTGLWKPVTNRLGKYINPALLRWTFTNREKHPLNAALPPATNVIVLVSTTSANKLHMAWCLLRQGYTVVPYFMDDWLANNSLKWKTGSIQKIAADLLTAAPCWLAISRQLKETLVKRYSLGSKPCLVIHNPSPFLQEVMADNITLGSELVSDTTMDVEAERQKSKTTNRTAEIAYAGSIWPMHFDALWALAKAIHLLNVKTVPINFNPVSAKVSAEEYNKGLNLDNPSLIIYTSETAWQQNRKWLEGPGVRYGGFIPYLQIQERLQKAWLLLVTASFLPEYTALSNSSVQTKLTDYMAAGRPVLMVGPANAASTQFVHEWDCGYSINTSRPDDIAAQLLTIKCMTAQSQKKAANGLCAAKNQFSKPVVQEKLYRFFNEIQVNK